VTSAEMFDRIDHELGQVNRIVDVAAGSFLLNWSCSPSKRRGVELVIIRGVGFFRVDDAVTVQVAEEVR